MNEQERKDYLEKYKEAKKKGVPFYPDILFKDAVIALVVFLVLVGFAYFVGAPLEPRADPADSTYTPRPEWYFLFLFQLLKYFPGNLEVIGVIVIPGIVILLMLLLPLLDRSPKRHFFNRPWITGITSMLVLGILVLSVLSYLETPPPAEKIEGDPVASLYTENCSSCHGPSITVPEGIDLHQVIARGNHEGMPTWSGDLDTNEIDALAGFITSPGGNQLYNQYCLECHQVSDLVASNPIVLRDALEEGITYPPHLDLEIPEWNEFLSNNQVTDLLNFLVAPDGQRLYAVNCASCHGTSVAFAGEQEDLRQIISQGGLHLEMPSLQGSVTSSEMELLANYVIDPTSFPEAEEIFNENCGVCHGSRIPVAGNYDLALSSITSGGSHQTMPVWGDLLTASQLEALTAYTWDAAQGTSIEEGQTLYANNCVICHGTFGEGGRNPARSDDIIGPISSAEYLSTRDNITLFNVIAQGQPNFGMAPFGNSFGGPLSGEQIDALIAFIRTWEANPPVELPPEVQQIEDIRQSAEEIYNSTCTQCHTPGDNTGAPDLADPAFQAGVTDSEIYDSIRNGHPSTIMIAFSSLLTNTQIENLVKLIRDLASSEESGNNGSSIPSFSADILPILVAECNICHGSLGGWDGSSYDSVINSGDNGPAVIPGDAANSLLAQKLLDTQQIGGLMPPAGKLDADLIQLFLDWIIAGAPDN
jgi:mono/diheme cytochrome c family protein